MALGIGTAHAAGKTWNVTGGNWDYSTANWTNSAGASVAFTNGDDAIFSAATGDSAISLALTNVTVRSLSSAGTNTPATLTITGVAGDTLTLGTGTAGTGNIADSPATTNAYAGNLKYSMASSSAVDAFSLAAGSGTSGTPAVWNIASGDTLYFNGSGVNILDLNANTVNLTGAGEVEFQFNNSSSILKSSGGVATLNVNAGTLYLAGGGSTACTFDSSLTMNIAAGAILNCTPNTDGGNLHYNMTVNLNGGTLTGGSGSPTISGPVNLVTNSTVNASFATILAGTVSGTGNLTCSGTLTLKGTNTYTGTTTISSGTLTLGGAGQLGGGTYAGNITNTGTFSYSSSAAQTLSGVISGTGQLIKTNSGTLTLSGNNTSSGGNIIGGGTLLLTGTLGAGTTTVGSNSIFAGNGVVNGSTVVQWGGTLQPGTPAANTVSLTVSNNLSLAGNCLFVLNRTNAQNSSSVLGVNTVTYGGTLIVSNAGPALQAGDSFALFQTAAYAGGFTNVALPMLAGPLVWNTNALSVNGTISVSNQTYQLTYTPGTNGTLTGMTNQVVSYGGNGSAVTAVPNSGYVFNGWSDGMTNNPRTDTNVTANLAVTANFASTMYSTNTYTLTYATIGTNGSITGATNQTVNYGGNGTTVVAVPNTGCYFAGWSDGLTNSTRTDLDVTTNLAVTASFRINTYTLNYASANTNGVISGATNQVVNYNANGTSVTATPNSGCYFTGWSDGSRSNPRTDLNVTNNIAVTAGFAPTISAVGGDTVTWYTSPGTNNMSQGLLLGNGRMGAMVPGNVTNEVIALNESSLWSGTTNISGAYDGQNGEYGTFGSYQPFGSLVIQMPQQTGYSGYLRTLDLNTGVATVTYTNGGVGYTRTLFCSAPDQVMVVELSASVAAAYTGSIQIDDARGNAPVSTPGGTMFSGVLTNGELYEAQMQVTNNGGTLVNSGGVINFTNCTSLTLVIALGTDYSTNYYQKYKGNNPHSNVVAQAQAAIAQPFATLQTSHTNDFSALFNRVSIFLGTPPAGRTNLPTDQRISANVGNDSDPGIESLVFQNSRYLTISGSRGTGCSLNLQGIWNDNFTPPWGCDYHMDQNYVENYWSSEITSLPECTLPYANYIQSQIPSWRYYTTNRPSWMGQSGTNNCWSVEGPANIWGGTAGSEYHSANAWLCMTLWDHYDYTRDTNYLRNTAYPILKQVCSFWQQNLFPLAVGTTDGVPAGVLIVSNGWSAEHGPVENGVTGDQVLIWDVFNNYLQACSILNTDAVYAVTISNMQANLLGPRVGPQGEMREWLYTPDTPGDNSDGATIHLSCLYPGGRQVNPERTPALAAAARVSLQEVGLTGYEWAYLWRMGCYDRLYDWYLAHRELQDYMGSVQPNLLGNFPGQYSFVVSQMDSPGEAGAAIAEMLLQSHEGFINLLPTLPNAWPNGYVTGLSARGGYTVGISWTNASAMATIKAGLNGLCTVHAPNPAAVTLNGVPVTLTTNAAGNVQWSAVAGATYTLQWVQPPFPAQLPVPMDYATGVNVGAAVSWIPGGTNYLHNLYFGTSSNAVAVATTNSPEFQGQVNTTNSSLPLLQTNTTCFWRVDEVNGTNTGTGRVWQFVTSGSFSATNPVPAMWQGAVPVSQTLSWTPGVTPNTNCLHDVYLGTNSTAVATATTNSASYQGRFAVPRFTPGTNLLANTIYYWRVDEIVSNAVSPGAVWSFTTAADQLHSALDFYYTMDTNDLLNTTNILDHANTPPNNGTLYPATNLPVFGPGQVKQAVVLNGTNQYVASPTPNIGTSNATFLCWINRNGAQSSYAGILFCRGTTTVAGLDFNGANNTLGYHWNNDANTYNYNSGLTPPSGQWALAALVVSSSNAVFYLGTTNGTLTAATHTYPHVLQAFDGPVCLGQDSSGGRLFNGAMDEAYFWTRSLSPSEIGVIFTNGLNGLELTNPPPPQGPLDTWTGGGSDNNWSTGGNWGGHAPNVAGDNLLFTGSTRPNNTNDWVSSVGSVRLNPGTAFTNSGLALTITGGITNSAQNNVWNISLTLGANQGVDTATGTTLTLNGIIAGSYGLTFADGGTAILTAANTYTGGTVITGGALTISGPGQLGGGSYAGNIADNGVFNCGGTLAQTLSGVISGSGTLNASGSGTLTLSGANTYSGGTTVTPNGDVTGLAAASASALGAGLMLVKGDNQYAASVSVNGGLTITNAVTLRRGNSGSGRATIGLGAAAIWSGPITLDNSSGTGFCGVITGGGSAANASIIAGNIGYSTLGTAATFVVRGSAYGRVTGALVLSNGYLQHLDTVKCEYDNTNNVWGTLDVNNASSVAYVGARNAVSAGGVVYSSLGGTLQLTDFAGANSYSQTIAGLSGNVNVTQPATNNPVTLTLGGSTNVVHTGVISGALALVKNGNGTQTLSGANTYTGTTTVSNGTLLINGSLATGAVTVFTNAVLGGTGSMGGAVTVNGGGTLRVNPAATGVGKLTLAGSLTFGSGATNILCVSKNGGVDTNDLIQISGGVTLAGTLVVTNIGTNEFVSGDSFKLFQAGTYAAGFTNYILPALTHGLVWNTSLVGTNGTLTVVTSNGPPVVVVSNYTLAYQAGPNGTVSGSTPQTVSYGSSGTAVTAVPNAGCYFVNWSDGSPANPRTDANVTSNVTVTANFAVLAQPAITNAGMAVNGLSFLLGGNGTAGQSYVLLTASNLTSPWVPVQTNLAGTNGMLNFTDPQVTNYPQRFYRIRSQ